MENQMFAFIVIASVVLLVTAIVAFIASALKKEDLSFALVIANLAECVIVASVIAGYAIGRS